ncbi:MAG TPA: GMC family oxidoreductase [Steroidobacteraceae bacterium]|jgi:choline dehydrogenase-like flavoprotein
MSDSYDMIIVGTGFAGSFFLMSYLQRAPKNARVLVLERGRSDSKSWQLIHRRDSSMRLEDVYVNNNPDTKVWLTSPGFGGNSKCWYAGTIRMMPGDFKLKSRYGVGNDWPMTYEDLAPYYDVVEQVMNVSGPADSPMPRSQPFPLPPHRFSTPDELLKAKFPDSWFNAATARASAPTGQRGVCCASGVCHLCPVDAKFTIQNGLAHLYDDARVTLQLESEVDGVDVGAGVARGVHYTRAGRAQRAEADVVVLAASALFNPHIMLRSGMRHPWLGAGLHEQPSFDVCVDLAGVKADDGSTVITGNGYMFYDGEHRRERAACMIELWSSPFADRPDALRSERGRWRERQYFAFLFDDLPQLQNRVTVHAAEPRLAETTFLGHSAYTQRAVDRIPEMVAKLGQALPIERIVSIGEAISPGHIQGTVVMGEDPASSIVDGHLVHHQIRNLLILGASSFPTATPILPTLTVSALSLRSAEHFFNNGAPTS